MANETPYDPTASCQPCGCDPGANWMCAVHRRQKLHEELVAAGMRQIDVQMAVREHSENETPAPTRATTLPTDPKERKKHPVATGVLDYFPDALVAIAHVSWAGNEQHNPGEPLHWARGKSMDQDDTIIRHFLQRGTRDSDGLRHSAKMAWRALALLQLEIEGERS